MASTDARPVPIKNTAYRAVFPIYNNTGALVSGAAGLDSEVSKDQGTFTDCTNEATEIATSSGVYYLDITSTEMNADSVAVIVKTSTTDAKTTLIVLYPQESGDIKVDVQSFGGAAGVFSGGRPEVNVSHFGGNAGTFASGIPAVNATQIEGSDATNQIRDAVVDDATRIDASALNTLSGHDPGEAIMGATDLGTGAGLTSLASAANLSTVAGYVDTEIGAILTLLGDLETLLASVHAKTTNLPASPAATSDIPTAVQNADALLGRNIAGGSNGGRTVTQAFRRLRNRVAVLAGILTVYREDDTASDWTAAVTTAAGDPVSEVDPS
jgi:hypothetical protein